MEETPQEYRRRLLGYLGKQNPFTVMAATTGKLKRLLQRCSRADLIWRRAPKKWNIAEIVAHLAEVEIVLAYRLRMIASVKGVPIQAMDQNKWILNAGYLVKDVQGAVELFDVVRNANLRFVRSLPARKRNHYGFHAERGEENIMMIIKMYAGHDLNHLMQIETILRWRKHL
jgi:hypothetical protein